MSDNGWIKLHRKIKDNWIWNDPEKCVAWLDILLSVNHKDKQIVFNGHPITIHAGQRLTSLSKLASEWGWTRNRVDRFLRTLTETNMITANRTPNGTLLTVINWGFYQGQRDSRRDSRRDTSEATYEATNGTPVKHKQEYIKNDKNDKEEREGQAPHTPYAPQEEDIEAYCEKHGIRMNVPRFMAYYGARDWTLGKGLKVTRWEQVEQLITTWQTSNVESNGDPEYVERIPYYQEFDVSEPVQLASVSPFKGSVASEMLKRKRKKVANER